MDAKKLVERMDRNRVNRVRRSVNEVTCYGQTMFHDHCQEWYETGAPDARQRSGMLRKLGYKVASSPMGCQVTPVGLVKMTLMNIYWGVDRGLPADAPPPPDKIERM